MIPTKVILIDLMPDLANRMSIKEPGRIPTREGYDFLGWEIVRTNPDGSVNNSFRETYGVPELYAFGNEVVEDAYLKAIWVENRMVDVYAYHHFYDQKGNETIKETLVQTLPNRRINSSTEHLENVNIK